MLDFKNNLVSINNLITGQSSYLLKVRETAAFYYPIVNDFELRIYKNTLCNDNMMLQIMPTIPRDEPFKIADDYAIHKSIFIEGVMFKVYITGGNGGTFLDSNMIPTSPSDLAGGNQHNDGVMLQLEMNFYMYGASLTIEFLKDIVSDRNYTQKQHDELLKRFLYGILD